MLSKHLPRELWDRPKKGFDAPIGEWLRGPMRAWAEDILFANRAYEDELLSPSSSAAYGRCTQKPYEFTGRTMADSYATKLAFHTRGAET